MQPVISDISKPREFLKVLGRSLVEITEDYEYTICYWDGEMWRGVDNRRAEFQPEEWVYLGAGFHSGGE